MTAVEINFIAVIASGIIIFLLGGLWYSPLLFAKSWMSLIGKTDDELKKESKPANYVIALMQGIISSYVLAVFIQWADAETIARGAWIGFLCWFGFAGTTSFLNNMFGARPVKLWMIDSGYNLVSFIAVGIILAIWK